MITVFLLLLAIQIILPAAIYLGRDRLMFFPSTTPGPEAGLGTLRGAADLKIIHIRRGDGRLLAAYDGRPKTALPQADDTPVPTVLFFHGNAGNIAFRAPLLEQLVAATEARIVMLDYSGYGGNAGSPSEVEVTRDGLAAYDHLIHEGVMPEHLVLYGESLGGAVALAVAEAGPCAGVVVQSTFASLSSMARAVYPWLPFGAFLARDSFPSDARAARLDVPLLVVHGDRDEIVPYAEGRKIHRMNKNAELLTIEGAGHNDLFSIAGNAYLEELGKKFRIWTILQDRNSA